MTLLEKLCQNLIDLFLCSDNLSLTREQYKATVAAVIKEAKAEALRDVEKCLGRDLDKAIEQLTWLDEFHDEEAIYHNDLREEWKDKEEVVFGRAVNPAGYWDSRDNFSEMIDDYK